MSNVARAITVIDNNPSVIQEFFTGIAGGSYYDGMCHQLYLDLDDDSLMIHMEASNQSWLQRDDGSLVRLLTVQGYDDRPEDEKYHRGDDPFDFGFTDWLDGELTPALERAFVKEATGPSA